MEFTPAQIPDVVVIDPLVFEDSRGFLMETWRASRFSEAGIGASFVQDVHSRSARRTVRGLHYQIGRPQGKLIRVIHGEVFDVAVDIRKSSPTFGQWVGEVLSSGNRRLIWIPPGFAHGFMVLSEYADFEYRLTDYYAPEEERTILWNDPDIGISWPDSGLHEPVLSDKDRAGHPFRDAEVYA
jgi:dTDP-4-dehydrorhamnose 3,5-epimerase